MSIEIKDLVNQAVKLATERRQKTLSEQESASINGGARGSLLESIKIIFGYFYQ